MNNNYQKELTQIDSLKFNGKVTASISHDIKNVLAIINENAGLLQDISVMIEQGFILSSQRLYTIAMKIENQINRANEIITRLNKFAHSVDEEIIEFDLFEVIESMTKIYERIGKMKGLIIVLNKPSKSFKLKSNLFYFQYLIWNCLDFIIRNIKKELLLNLTINFENNIYYINFNLSENTIYTQNFGILIEQENAVLEALKAQIIYGNDCSNFMIEIKI